MSLRSNAYVENVITSTNVAVISLIFMCDLATPNQYIVIKNSFEWEIFCMILQIRYKMLLNILLWVLQASSNNIGS